jgi:hypothetical protein
MRHSSSTVLFRFRRVYVKYGAHVQKVVQDTDREIESKNRPTHNHTDERKIYTCLSDESS